MINTYLIYMHVSPYAVTPAVILRPFALRCVRYRLPSILDRLQLASKQLGIWLLKNAMFVVNTEETWSGQERHALSFPASKRRKIPKRPVPGFVWMGPRPLSFLGI